MSYIKLKPKVTGSYSFEVLMASVLHYDTYCCKKKNKLQNLDIIYETGFCLKSFIGLSKFVLRTCWKERKNICLLMLHQPMGVCNLHFLQLKHSRIMEWQPKQC